MYSNPHKFQNWTMYVMNLLRLQLSSCSIINFWVFRHLHWQLSPTVQSHCPPLGPKPLSLSSGPRLHRLGQRIATSGGNSSSPAAPTSRWLAAPEAVHSPHWAQPPAGWPPLLAPLPSLLTLKAPFISPPTKQMDSGESSGSCAATGSASSRRSTGRIAGASLRRSSRGGPSRRACSAPGRLPGAHVTFFSLQIRLSRACCEW